MQELSTSLFSQRTRAQVNMSSVVSLSSDVVQELLTNLLHAEQERTNQIQSSLLSLRKNDENYSKTFVKHIGGDAQLCGKYELVCDLRKSAMSDHESEVSTALNAQSAAIQQSLVKLNDIITNSIGSTNSVDSDTSLSVKVDHNDRKRKRPEVTPVSSVANLLSDVSERPAKRKRIDIANEVHEPHIIGILEEEMRSTNQTNSREHDGHHRGNQDVSEPNISGVWVYPADNRFRIILQEDSFTGHVTGIMVLHNETQCSIEGNRKVDIERNGTTADKSYYRICKIFPEGQRANYSVDLGPNHDTMTITKDGDTRSKTVVLETKEIPSHFQEQIVCN